MPSKSGKRTKTGQKAHDQAVRRSAAQYRGQGFKVSVDLPGEPKPKSIGGFRPDLIAKKGKKEIIVEIETPETAKIDKDQHDAFRGYANRKAARKFRKRITYK